MSWRMRQADISTRHITWQTGTQNTECQYQQCRVRYANKKHGRHGRGQHNSYVFIRAYRPRNNETERFNHVVAIEQQQMNNNDADTMQRAYMRSQRQGKGHVLIRGAAKRACLRNGRWSHVEAYQCSKNGSVVVVTRQERGMRRVTHRLYRNISVTAVGQVKYVMYNENEINTTLGVRLPTRNNASILCGWHAMRGLAVREVA